MVQQKLFLVREAVMGALITFSIVVVAVNAHYIFVTLNDILLVDGFVTWPQDTPDTFSVFNVAVAALTILTVPAMLLIDRMRSGAFTSMILFELAWLGVLCILWIASASFTVDSVRLLLALCSLRFNKKVGVLQSACRDVRASEAFGHLAWVTLFGYIAALFWLSFKSSQQGTPVWRSAVRQTHFTTDLTLPKFGQDENTGRHDLNGLKDQVPAVVQQNLGYAYPPAQLPIQQPDMSQPQLGQPIQPLPQVQPPAPYGQVQYGQPQAIPQPVGQPPVVPYGQA